MAVNVALSFPGVLVYKEMMYTQTGGTSPDKVSLKIAPQSTPPSAVGDLIFTYDGVSLTLPDCLIDRGNIRYDQQGWVGSFVLLDRRWKWAKAANMVVHWNDRTANGAVITPSQRTVSQMLAEVLEWIGESSYDLSDVDATDYPEFNELSTHPLDILNQINDLYGYEVILGFGSEAVKIVKVNTGLGLPAGGIRMLSTSYDPPTPVNIARTHFGPSRMEARLKLQAIGLDTDGEFKDLDDLSYKPSGGWKYEPPGDFGSVLDVSGSTAQRLAVKTVYRYYRVSGFADGTGVIPDGSGTIEHPSQLLPILDGLFPISTGSGDFLRPRQDIYGEVLKSIVNPAPAGVGNTDVGTLLETEFELLKSEGIVIFPTDQPMYKIEDSEILPAELWLECTFQIHQNNNWQFGIYSKDVVVDSSGFGVKTISLPEVSNQVRITYDSENVATGSTSTAAQLDTIAIAMAADVSASYSAESGTSIWYAAPQMFARLDGAISQLTFMISDTNAHYSIVSRNMSHDTHVRDAVEKRTEALERFSRDKERRFRIARLRKESNRD